MAIPMIESPIGAIGRGIGEGIQNVAAISNIQQNREKAKREAKTFENQQITFDQQQEMYKAQNAPVDPQQYLDSLGLDEEGKAEVKNTLTKTGLLTDFSKPIPRSMGIEIMKDPRVQNAVYGHQYRTQAATLSASDNALAALKPTDAGYAEAKAVQEGAKARIMSNPFFKQKLEIDKLEGDITAKAQELGFKKQELDIHAATARGTEAHQKAMLEHAQATEKLQLEMKKMEAKRLDIASRELGVKERSEATDEIVKRVKLMSEKKPLSYTDENGATKVAFVDDTMSGLRAYDAANPGALKKHGFSLPKDSVSWEKEWPALDAGFNQLKTEQEKDTAAAQVAERLKKMGVSYDTFHTSKYFKEKGLKNIEKYVEKYFPNPNPQTTAATSKVAEKKAVEKAVIAEDPNLRKNLTAWEQEKASRGPQDTVWDTAGRGISDTLLKPFNQTVPNTTIGIGAKRF
jgi:hypothetical protein